MEHKYFKTTPRLINNCVQYIIFHLWPVTLRVLALINTVPRDIYAQQRLDRISIEVLCI